MAEDQNFNYTDNNSTEPILDNGFLRRRLRKDHSRIGFSLLLLMGVWVGTGILFSLFLMVFDKINGTSLVTEVEKYSLFFNEAFLILGIVAAFLLLFPMPTAVPQKQPVSFGFIFKFSCICFAVSSACNLPINFIINIWNLLTNSAAGNEVSDLLGKTDILQSLLFVGIVGPILEEFFFRKVLIDRLRGYDDRIAIVVSSLLFGLYHMNFRQFFYTVGIGLVLGFVYCKTGKTWVTMLLHAIFNIFSGVIMSWVSTRLATSIDALKNNTPGAITPEVITMLLALLVAIVYISLISAATVVGVVFFIKELRRMKWTKGEKTLHSDGIVGAIIGNPGMIVAISVMGFFTIASLF